ncbi:MAG TPA: magnesium/cobalt transporter CorA [Candidatus Limnocylindrales bacterium]
MTWSQSEGTQTLGAFDELKAVYARPDTRVWIDLEDPDRELLDKMTKLLGLHPLITEDILESNQRAKVEVTGANLHIVIFALHHDDDRIVNHEIDIVLGQRFLLTVHDPSVKPRDAPFMSRNSGAHLDGGVDYTLWAVCDWIVDDYFPVFDTIGDEIDELEDAVMRAANRSIVERLFDLRKDLLVIRHAVNPVREIFNQLTNRDLGLVEEERIVYFRDIYDHLIRLNDELDSYRELVSTTLDIYLSQINNNLSEIMKRLTGVTVVLATIGAIGGIFGMSEAGSAFNFTESWGFWAVTLAAIAIAISILLFFRRRGWI